jgi:hypothetical protein
MLNINQALNNDCLLRALTELNGPALEALLPGFDAAYRAHQLAAKPTRQRARGGQRKARLEAIESKLFYILLCFTCYPTFDLAGILFNFDRSKAPLVNGPMPKW